MYEARKILLRTFIIAGAIFVLLGCERQPPTVKGFVLPAGDLERGKAAFVELGCRQCHHVAGIDLAEYESAMRFELTLGGEVLKVRRYGDLLNSVVNPNHELAEPYVEKLGASERTRISPMPDFSAHMTVQQLVDIVEFLHAQYRLTMPEYEGIVMGP